MNRNEAGELLNRLIHLETLQDWTSPNAIIALRRRIIDAMTDEPVRETGPIATAILTREGEQYLRALNAVGGHAYSAQDIHGQLENRDVNYRDRYRIVTIGLRDCIDAGLAVRYELSGAFITERGVRKLKELDAQR